MQFKLEKYSIVIPDDCRIEIDGLTVKITPGDPPKISTINQLRDALHCLEKGLPYESL